MPPTQESIVLPEGSDDKGGLPRPPGNPVKQVDGLPEGLDDKGSLTGHPGTHSRAHE